MKTHTNTFDANTVYATALALILGLGCTLPTASVADTQTASTAANTTAAAQRLNSLLAKTQSLSANFVQTTKTSKSSGAMTGAPNQLKASTVNKNFSGTMAFAKPNRFRWETTSPAPQLIVSKGQTLWIYDPDLEQATQQAVDAQMANTPALLLSGDTAAIAKSFVVLQPNTSKDVFVLTPKNKEAAFERLAIAFVDKKPRSMVLHDALGQVTTIKFTNLKLNPSLNAATFSFTPPKGVDVIYQ